MAVQSTYGVSFARRPPAQGVVVPAHDPGRSVASRGFVAWIVLIGIALPSNMTFFLAGAKFTPARLVICLLMLPGLAELVRKGRHLAASDLFVCLAMAWMFLAVSQTDESWSSTAALIFEFGGGYLVARAYFHGRPALGTFVRALKAISIMVIGLAILEQLLHYHIGAALFGLTISGYEYRYGWLRSFSTFPHPILYGTFCASTGTIFLYSERSFLGRIFYGGLCFFGCLLAMSSAPLMSFVIAVLVGLYDSILHSWRWRWQALVAGISALLVAVSFAASRPVSWIIANLTLDPSTGYFRVATWDSSFFYIGASPYFGYGFNQYAPVEDFFGNVSVDSTWLVMALRFGLPSIALLLTANVTSFFSGGSNSVRCSSDPFIRDLRTGFTLTLVVLMFVGLTVHYWNNVWLFWGVCLGIRVSLQELRLNTRSYPMLLGDRPELESVQGHRAR
ncbi:O-antigen ligase family protein [Bradyrhizobium canariense]|uniref:O-antigen ligase family protein n=1 Tax=Bradyrhizobium canariense TaxID=255045 RepID=UPI001CA5649A|nr:O-antigen ligase family protein [Bradyrhizobium canariense]MBW5438027.1 O-antigen ligase family protein [Bradyrhizobium canariense]